MAWTARDSTTSVMFQLVFCDKSRNVVASVLPTTDQDFAVTSKERPLVHGLPHHDPHHLADNFRLSTLSHIE